MDIARVHQWAGICFIAVYVITLAIRGYRMRGNSFMYHVGPAFIGAGGVTAIFESTYLIFRALQGTVATVQGLTIYAIAGGLALFTAGIACLVQGFKE